MYITGAFLVYIYKNETLGENRVNKFASWFSSSSNVPTDCAESLQPFLI